MRLRQAHAILEASRALEAAGLGFELWPFQYDYPGAPRGAATDRMSGYAEFTDPDREGRDARIYNIDIGPGPDDNTIEASLTFGLGPDPESLLYSKFSVAIDTDADQERFRGLVGARLAEKIAETVREHETPYQAAYEKRTRHRDA